MKQPTAYTTTEGGIWHPWDIGLYRVEVTEDLLCIALENTFDIKYSRAKTYIGNVMVHSLLFGPISDSASARWDCVNGWTRKLQ